MQPVAHKGQPIAVIDQYGMLLPFTDNGVDAVHLLKMGVTYIYTEDELERARQNEKYWNRHDFENPSMYHGSKKLQVLRKPQRGSAEESHIVIINPENVPLDDTEF